MNGRIDRFSMLAVLTAFFQSAGGEAPQKYPTRQEINPNRTAVVYGSSRLGENPICRAGFGST